MRFSSKKEQIYAFLREGIMAGTIEPGSRLVIDKLAEDLNISQTPLREVLRMLENDGLVEIVPYIGARVAPLEAQSIHEIFAMLTALEVISTRLACERMSDAQIETLAAKIDVMAGLMDQPNAWSQENKALHLYICECATMPLMLRTLRLTLDHWDRLRSIYLNDVSSRRIAAAHEEHRALLSALRERNPDRVEQILNDHNAASLASYLVLLEESGALEKLS